MKMDLNFPILLSQVINILAVLVPIIFIVIIFISIHQRLRNIEIKLARIENEINKKDAGS